MTDALFRIPSRTVKFGYVNMPVEVTPEASPEMLAAQYVNYVYAFQKEEEAAVARLLDASSGALKAPLAASQPEVDHPVDPVDRAAQMLAEGLGGVTEVEAGDIVSHLGYSDEPRESYTNEPDAPWKQEVATPKKPWEAEHKVGDKVEVAGMTFTKISEDW